MTGAESRGSGDATGRSNTLIVVGLAALANGAALVAHILVGFPLPLMLAVTWTVALVSVAALSMTGDALGRAMVVRTVGIGLVAGILATIAYDVTKTILSQLDPSPFNPFEATRVFGTLLVGDAASPALIWVAGWAFHLANGVMFGIAFACLFVRFGRGSLRWGFVGGVAWGLFLETFMLSLYPGWLNVRFLDEFRQISFLSHLVFGAVLGLTVPRLLLRSTRGAGRNRGG